MATILDRYFELSDEAGVNKDAFRELVGLFAEHSVLHTGGGDKVVGVQAIEQFFEGFLNKNAILKHVWHIESTYEGLRAAWAVAGKRQNGEIFALQGVDIAQLGQDGRIQSLEVQIQR